MENYFINHQNTDVNIIYEHIRNIMNFLGASRAVYLPDLVIQYFRATKRDLLLDIMAHNYYSLEAFLINSDTFKLYSKNGQTYVYIAPDKLKQEERAPQRNKFSSKPKVKPFKKFQKNKFRKSKYGFSSGSNAGGPVIQQQPGSYNYNGPQASYHQTSNKAPGPVSDHFPAYTTDSGKFCAPPKNINPVIPVPKVIQKPGPQAKRFKSSNVKDQFCSNLSYGQQIASPLELNFEETYRGDQDLSAFSQRNALLAEFSFNDLPFYRQICFNQIY